MRNLIDQPVSIKLAVPMKPRMAGNTSIPWELESHELPEGHPMSGSDWKFEISADVSLGDPGRRSGHPDSWYPPEGGYCDLVDVMMYVSPDTVWVDPCSIATAERLFMELIGNDRELSERIEEALVEAAVERKADYRDWDD